MVVKVDVRMIGDQCTHQEIALKLAAVLLTAEDIVRDLKVQVQCHIYGRTFGKGLVAEPLIWRDQHEVAVSLAHALTDQDYPLVEDGKTSQLYDQSNGGGPRGLHRNNSRSISPFY